MFIPDPDFYPSRSRISDPNTATKNRGAKKFVVIPFFVATNFTKLKTLNFEMLKKKMWANFQRFIELFTQKIVTMLSKIWVWDPGSGKNLFRIQGSKRHRIPDPQHCMSTFCRLSSGAPRRRRSNLALRGAPTARLREGGASSRPSGELTMAPATLFLLGTAMFLIFRGFWLKVERALLFSLHDYCKRKKFYLSY
jgi:hypothetical protein